MYNSRQGANLSHVVCSTLKDLKRNLFTDTMMNFGQGTEARGIVGASGSFLADSAASGCGGRLSDAGGALGGEHFGGNLAALRAGVGHGQGFGRGHQQSPSLVNHLESLCETIKVICNDIKS